MHRFAVLALLSGCAGKSHALDQPFTLAIGEQLRVDAVTVALESLVEDSRCPEGVQCIWAGQTTFGVAMSTDGERVAGEVIWPGEPMAASGYTLELTEVQPPKTAPATIEESQYRATFVVRRAAP
ncbi:MAG: hypothetical protein AAF602_18560 [Myxococcota bacterium]